MKNNCVVCVTDKIECGYVRVNQTADMTSSLPPLPPSLPPSPSPPLPSPPLPSPPTYPSPRSYPLSQKARLCSEESYKTKTTQTHTSITNHHEETAILVKLVHRPQTRGGSIKSIHLNLKRWQGTLYTVIAVTGRKRTLALRELYSSN